MKLSADGDRVKQEKKMQLLVPGPRTGLELMVLRGIRGAEGVHPSPDYKSCDAGGRPVVGRWEDEKLRDDQTEMTR